MSAHSLVDVQPLGRLLFRPRAVLGAIGVGAWVLGIGWIGLATRFASVRDRVDDADLLPLLVAAGLVMIPAFFGAVASEALHEVLRRPMTFMLPGLQRRLRSSTLLFTILVSLVLAVGLSFFQPGFAPLEAVGPALLGVAVGSWVMVRVGGAGFWMGRLVGVAALAYFAGPLCAAATGRPLVSALFALMGLALLALRLGPGIMRASLFQETPTFLTILFAKGRRSPAPRTQDAAPLPPERLGGSVAGWVAARRFELSAAESPFGTFAGIQRFAFLAMVMAGVGALITGWLEGEGALDRLAHTLIGLADTGPTTDGFGPTTLVYVIGMYAGMLAWVGSVPLLANGLFPMSRAMHARLALRVGLTTILHVTIATLVAGALLSAVILTLSGHEWPDTLPVFAWVALANLLVMPWVQVGVHTLMRTVGRIPAVVTIGAAPLTLTAVCFSLAEVREDWDSLFAGVRTWQIVLGYLAVLGASLAFLRGFLTWHFRTCDLVRD